MMTAHHLSRYAMHIMNKSDTLTENHAEPGFYEIRLKGHLDNRWADWFDGLTITLANNGETILTGSVVDQAALHGLLKKIRDVGMPLLSVNYFENGLSDTSDVE
jgi:hypothetical protein